MILRYFYDRQLAQASYLVGCAKTGEALVVDPMRDIRPYLETASAEGLRITHVTETHIHADFVSGTRELGDATGARLFLSDMGTADWKYGYTDQPNVTVVRDGDQWMVGNIRVDVLHTPGHTPEHIAFMITDTAGADRPMGIFTGDFVFVGDIGRPDLLEEAAGFIGTKIVGAKQQFASLQRLKGLPDYLQLWPAHGAGSACGKALGAVPSTTLGYEKLFNPAFQFTDEAAFVDWLLSGQPEPPRYFAQMKYVNKIGPALTRTLKSPYHLSNAALGEMIDADLLVIDLRASAEFIRGHYPGTISIPMTSSSYTTYIGWLVDYRRPLYVITPHEAQMAGILTSLRAIGVDSVGGYFLPGDLGTKTPGMPYIKADALPDYADALIVDVRGASEFADRHIQGAVNIPLGFLPGRIHELPRDRRIITQCASGYRSLVAASLLSRAGFTNVINLWDTDEQWARRLPTVTGALVPN